MAITAFTDFSSTEPRDPASGRLLKHLTQRQLDAVLERHPHLREVAPVLPDPNAKPEWHNPEIRFNGAKAHTFEQAARERARGALLADPVRKIEPTKPTKPAVTEMTRHRLTLHEASHGIVAHLLGRPIVRVSIIPDEKRAGHAWNYHPGEANKDDLIILAAGRACEEVLLGGVYEYGCGHDADISRKLALKLAYGDESAANQMQRESALAARALVGKYSSAIYRFSIRLAIKKEFVLDLAEAEIRACIEASKAKPSVSESNPKQKQELRKEAPKAGRVVRVLRADVPEEAAELARMLGLDKGADLIGHAPGQIVRAN